MTLRIAQGAAGVRFNVRVQPRASKNEISGAHGDALKVRVTAPAVEGAANEALVEFLATSFGLPRRDVTIVSGASSRSKVVELRGVSVDRVRQLMEK